MGECHETNLFSCSLSSASGMTTQSEHRTYQEEPGMPLAFCGVIRFADTVIKTLEVLPVT